MYLLLGAVLAIAFLALAGLRKGSDWLVVGIGFPVAAFAYIGTASTLF
jgi:hypothetical protein